MTDHPQRAAQTSPSVGPARGLKRTLRLIAALGVLLASLAYALPASAHRGQESYLYLDVGVEDLEGRVELPYEDIEEAFGLNLDVPSDAILSELAANLPELISYVDAHTAIGAAGQTWNLTFSDVRLLFEDGDADGPGYAIFPFEVDLPTAEVPRVLDVSFDPFLSELDNRRAIVLVGNDWQRGVFEEEANELLVFTPDRPSGTIDLGNPSQWLNFTGSIGLGVDHIRTGPDHIFFILVLLLPAVLVFRTNWKPAPTFVSSLWRVLKMVSMFTLAHSITFTLAGLGLVPLPPSKLVETIIAVSIAAAAIHNLRPIVLNREWSIAFVFGLFHGLGFASLVDALDTSRATQLISLLGRNVGIEIGQAVVVLVVFPMLFLLRRTRYYQPLFTFGSLALAVVSLIWAVERIFETEFGTTDFVLLFLKWPRSLVVMILGTIIAAAIFAFEKREERLLAVDGAGYEALGIDESTKVPSVR